MEDEGIMGLPAGQAMQNQAPPEPPVYVSSADAYDASLQGLGIATGDPTQAAAVKQAVRESIDELALSSEEVMALLDVLEYMSQNPDEYPELRQQLIEAEMMDPDDLPEEYDAAFLGMAMMVLNEYQMGRAEGAQAAMDMGPTVEGLGPMPMAQGGLADVAQYLAAQGRRGDTMLAHITPGEARLLQSLGGSATFNPRTGLPEFFLKKLFKSIKKAVKKLLKNPIVRIVATVAIASVLGPHAAALVKGITGATALSTAGAAAATALASTASAAAVSAMAGEKLNAKNLLVNAAASYFGAGGTIGKFAPLKMATDLAGRIPGVVAGGKVAQSLGSGLTSAAVGRMAGLSSDEALRMGLQAGAGTYFSKDTKPLAESTDAELKAQGYSDEAIQRIRAETPPTPAVAQTAAEQTPVGAPGPIGAPGPVGTAQDLSRLSEGQLFSMGYTPDEISAIKGTATVPTGQGLVPGETFTQRLGQFVDKPSFETAKNAFFVNPNAETTLGRYVPTGLTVAGIGALTGGFETEPVNQNPLFDRNYTGADYIRDNPQLFGGFLGRVEGMPAPFQPFVPTPSPTAGQGPRMPVYTPPRVPLPQPGGIPQPYNVAGLYGIPDLSAPVPQPVYGYSEGGSPKNTRFPRKTGAINGPGTGTSDSIPAMLSDGEFVFTAKAVRNAGGGSRRKGAKRMYNLMKKLEGGVVQG